MSCDQRGARGPPFSSAEARSRVTLPRESGRSIAGTGWCYDRLLDELNLCRDLPPDRLVDRDGVATAPEAASAAAAPLETLARLLAALLLATAAAAAVAHSESRRRASFADDADASAVTSVRRWLASPRALPSAWSPDARRVWYTCLALATFCFLAPLPWAEAAEYGSFSDEPLADGAFLRAGSALDSSEGRRAFV